MNTRAAGVSLALLLATIIAVTLGVFDYNGRLPQNDLLVDAISEGAKPSNSREDSGSVLDATDPIRSNQPRAPVAQPTIRLVDRISRKGVVGATLSLLPPQFLEAASGEASLDATIVVAQSNERGRATLPEWVWSQGNALLVSKQGYTPKILDSTETSRESEVLLTKSCNILLNLLSESNISEYELEVRSSPDGPEVTRLQAMPGHYLARLNGESFLLAKKVIPRITDCLVELRDCHPGILYQVSVISRRPTGLVRVNLDIVAPRIADVSIVPEKGIHMAAHGGIGDKALAMIWSDELEVGYAVPTSNHTAFVSSSALPSGSYTAVMVERESMTALARLDIVKDAYLFVDLGSFGPLEPQWCTIESPSPLHIVLFDSNDFARMIKTWVPSHVGSVEVSESVMVRGAAIDETCWVIAGNLKQKNIYVKLKTEPYYRHLQLSPSGSIRLQKDVNLHAVAPDEYWMRVYSRENPDLEFYLKQILTGLDDLSVSVFVQHVGKEEDWSWEVPLDAVLELAVYSNKKHLSSNLLR